MSVDREWLDISVEEYDRIQAVRSSQLRSYIAKGPLDYYGEYISKVTKKDGDPFRLGTCFHKAMECPNSWRDWVVRVPDRIEYGEFFDLAMEQFDQRPTAANSKAKIPVHGEEISLGRTFDRYYVEQFKLHAALTGREYLADSEIDVVECQVRAVWDNPECNRFLSQSGLVFESAVVRHDGPLKAKALLDVRCGNKVFADFKTTKARTPKQFFWEMEKFGYGRQIGFYRYASGIEDHKIIYVTKTAPFEAMLINVPIAYIEKDMHGETNEECIDRHLTELAQLYAQLNDQTECDSFGVPYDFHNEGWGAEIDPDMFNPLDFSDAEEVHFG